MGKNILQYLFSGYVKLLKKTVALEWQEIQFVTGNQVFGFWHEDSFLMNLVLEELSGKTSPVDVIVTADTRGDYIEHMLQACGGHALRVPDGFAAFGALKKILQDSYEQTRSIAVALGFNATYLSAQFSRERGETLTAYIHTLRLQTARRLLDETDLPVAEVAARVGMVDVAYFSRLFKKKYGLSPLRYRARPAEG